MSTLNVLLDKLAETDPEAHRLHTEAVKVVERIRAEIEMFEKEALRLKLSALTAETVELATLRRGHRWDAISMSLYLDSLLGPLSDPPLKPPMRNRSHVS